MYPDRLTGDHDLYFSLKIFLMGKTFEKEINIAYHREGRSIIFCVSRLKFSIADNKGQLYVISVTWQHHDEETHCLHPSAISLVYNNH